MLSGLTQLSVLALAGKIVVLLLSREYVSAYSGEPRLQFGVLCTHIRSIPETKYSR